MDTSIRGAVAAGDPQTVAAGTATLRHGGNAVDAAVAAAFAAFVCEHPLCSPMGGGVMLRAGSTAVTAVDFFARTPGVAGERPTQLDFHHVEVDFGPTKQAFHIGRGSAAVPGALTGLIEVHRRWGRLPLRELSGPAVELARSGFRLSPALAWISQLLGPIARWSEGTRALFFDGPELAAAGCRLRNPDLGAVLEEVARSPDGLQELYRQLTTEFGPAEGGLITTADVASFDVQFGPAVEIRTGEWTIFTMPAPSTGGVLMALGMRLLEGVGERCSFLSVAHMRELARVQDLTLRIGDGDLDRKVWQPEYVDDLLSDEALGALREQGEEVGPSPTNPLGSTTQISCIDRWGEAVSLTLTNGEGSGCLLTGTGVHVNNLLGEEDINPRGFHVDLPGQPLSTMMAPTIALHPGGDIVALGSGGSNRLRNAILTTLSHLLEHGVSVRAAVEAPRLHVTALPGAEPPSTRRPSLAFEKTGLSKAARAALEADYRDRTVVFDEPSMFFGGAHTVVRLGGTFGGAGDQRRGGWMEVVGPEDEYRDTGPS